MNKIITFAAVSAALQAAHHVGDYWMQTPRQATEKGSPGLPGALACAGHVATYTATCTAAVVALRALGAPITARGVIAGQVVNAVSHYVMDRRPWGHAIMSAVGKGQFATMGAPRDNTDDAPHLGTGAHALDQSWHVAWLAVSAYITAMLS